MSLKLFVFRLFILAFIFIGLGTYLYGTANAAACTSDECTGPGEYPCEEVNGEFTMCCTGGGCPSWDCTDNGCCPIQLSGGGMACRTRTLLSCPAVGTDLISCWPTTRADCLAEGCCWYSTVGCRRKPTTCPVSPTANFACAYDLTSTCYDCVGAPACTTTAPAQATLVSPSNGAVFFAQSSILLDWNAPTSWGEDCSSLVPDSYSVQVDTGAGYITVATVASSITQYNYNLDPTTNRTYRWRIISNNGALTSNSAEWSFTNNTGMTLTIQLQEVETDVNVCPASSLRPISGGSIGVTVDSTYYSPTAETDANGEYSVFVRMSSAVPPIMQICPSYAPSTCDTFGVKCAGSTLYSTLQGCVTVPQNTSSSTQRVVIQMARQQKDPWVAVVDGDVSTGSLVNIGSCTSGMVGGDFYGGILNLFNLAPSSNIYVISRELGVLTAGLDISEGSGGGYAYSVGKDDPYLDKFSFIPPAGVDEYVVPSLIPNPVTLRSGTFLVGITEANRFFNSPRRYVILSPTPSNVLSVFFIKAEPTDVLNINGSFTKLVPGSAGRVVIVTKAKVRVSPTVGYPSITLFNVNTLPQIDAVIISEKGIEVGSQYSSTVDDFPIVFNGPLISVNKLATEIPDQMQLLRNLGSYNSQYPGTVVKYPIGFLGELRNFIKYYNDLGLSTGLEVFDVQYDFVNVGEEVQ